MLQYQDCVILLSCGGVQMLIFFLQCGIGVCGNKRR